MKKYIKLFIAFVFILLTGLIFLEIREKENNESLQFSYNFNTEGWRLLLGNKISNESQITILNYFNTSCDFCQHEIKDVVQHLHLFKNAELLFVSEQPKDTILKFCTNYGLDTINNIQIYKVNYLEFIKNFGEVTPPTTFLFNQDSTLIKKYKGQVRAPFLCDEINAYLKKEQPND
jgi:peroxiredoxin